MDPIIFFTVLTVIYLVLLFFDLFFKSCMHYPYDAFLRNTGLNVQLFRLKWYTTAFNRTIFRLGSMWKNFFLHSFNFGVIASVCLIPIGLSLLLMNLFQMEKYDGGKKIPVSDVKIEILLPGVNLPLNEINFYILTLIICTIVHELGHAVAAVLDEVPIIGFGFTCYFCIPIAYTQINQEHLNSLKSFNKLRILCGGIWHNLVLSGLCFLIYSTLGTVVKPFYKLNEGLIITDISQKSPLLGEKGLQLNDIIYQINDCPMVNYDQYYDCLLKSIRQKPGFCVSSNFIHLHDESVRVSHIDGVIECCDSANFKQCCFELTTDDLSNDNPIEIPQHVCLDIRKTIEDSNEEFCTGTSCERGFCMKPLLRNTTTIMVIKRKLKDNVIYVGHPYDIFKTVKLSEFIPRSFLSPELGDSILLFLKYNIVFSTGLALINAIPCFGLDGYQICQTILNNLLLGKVVERRKRELIGLVVTSLGTLLFLSSILKIIWISIIKNLF